MRRFKKTTALLGGAAMLMALGTTSATAMRPGGGNGDNGGNGNVAVCHFPPGNPDNAHVIVISENAVPAHEAHGDFVLEDGDTCPPEDDNDDNDDNGDSGDNGDDEANCSVSQENGSDNSTGASSQSGLINLNNIGLQGLNLGIGNLLCQADILNGLTAAVLGTAIGGDSGGGDGGCVASQKNESQNSTGGSQQSGLVNVNNVGLQGLDIGVDNLLCQADILNNVTAGVLGTAIGGDADGDGDEGFLSGLLELDFLDVLAGLF